MLRRLFLQGASVLCVLLPVYPDAGTAAPFKDAGAAIDEVVADTDTARPLRRVAAPIPFENFRYPFVDDAENVLFIGNDKYTYRAKAGNGIYRSSASDGRLEALVLEDDPAPGDGKPMGLILGLQTDRRSFVFHRGPDRGQGIYARFGDGPVTAVANTGTPAPGANANFSWFWYADIWDDQVVFHGTVESPGQALSGLYLYQHHNRTVRRLIDTTQPVPAAGGSALGDLSYQPRIDDQWLVFSANQMISGAIRSGRGILGWPLAEGGDPAKIFALDRLKLLAPFGMMIPETDGRPLTSAPNPVVGDGLVAVVGGSDPEDLSNELPDWQAICIRTADGKWHNPVDTDTLIPGRNDGSVFKGFNKWIAIQDGKVIFRAYGPSGYEAVYLYDPASSQLFFVADTTWQVEKKAIIGFEVGRHPMVGRRLALMIRFADRTSGEYLATLSGLPTTPVRTAR